MTAPGSGKTVHGHGSLDSVLTRLAAVIEAENSVLSESRVTMHAGFAEEKNYALKEVMALQRVASPDDLLRCRPLLEKLSTLLRANARFLKIHISAMCEVSEIIIGGLADAESDGTYRRRPADVSR